MKYIASAVIACLASVLFATVDSTAQNASIPCVPVGGVYVDTLFKALDPTEVGLTAAERSVKPTILDRSNGYMTLKLPGSEGASREYTVALYQGGARNERIFLAIVCTRNYVGRMPETERLMFFEYAAGKCSNVTLRMMPAGLAANSGVVNLPRKGTDLRACSMVGDAQGLKEICTTFLWNVREARFMRKP